MEKVYIRDVMVGNYFKVQEPAIHWNGETYKDTIFEVSQILKRGVNFVGFNSLEEYGCLKPIELTVDILLKCGFPRVYIVEREDGIIFNISGFWYRKKYLHELQNLTFTLLGEHLKYNQGK